MEIVLMLLCIAGLAFTIKQVDGPFDLIAKTRNLLARIPFLGPLFFHAINCDFCLGFWASIAVYFVANSSRSVSLGELLVWSFGGGMFNLFFSKIVSNLDLDPINK